MRWFQEGMPDKTEIMAKITGPGLAKRLLGKTRTEGLLAKDDHIPLTMLDEEGEVRSSDELIGIGKGKVKDSGGERTMKIDAKKIGQEIVRGMQEEKRLEEDVLNAVDIHRSPNTSSDSGLYDHLPAKAESKDLLETISRDQGIDSRNQKSGDIDVFKSPEAKYGKMALEATEDKKSDAKTKKTKGGEDEVLAAVAKR